ncbi:MAG TPA: hypothetical protein VEF53_13185 [Patescibacteria group bacterium]|nr:hypothetical protein [Patescibacteria group bacterium]
MSSSKKVHRRQQSIKNSSEKSMDNYHAWYKFLNSMGCEITRKD